MHSILEYIVIILTYIILISIVIKNKDKLKNLQIENNNYKEIEKLKEGIKKNNNIIKVKTKTLELLNHECNEIVFNINNISNHYRQIKDKIAIKHDNRVSMVIENKTQDVKLEIINTKINQCKSSFLSNKKNRDNFKNKMNQIFDSLIN